LLELTIPATVIADSEAPGCSVADGLVGAVGLSEGLEGLSELEGFSDGLDGLAGGVVSEVAGFSAAGLVGEPVVSETVGFSVVGLAGELVVSETAGFSTMGFSAAGLATAGLTVGVVSETVGFSTAGLAGTAVGFTVLAGLIEVAAGFTSAPTFFTGDATAGKLATAIIPTRPVKLITLDK
jgi:hypothetical protein